MIHRYTPFDSALFKSEGECPICGNTAAMRRATRTLPPPLPIVFYKCRVCGHWAAPGMYRHHHRDGFFGRWQMSAHARTLMIERRIPPYFVMDQDELDSDTKTICEEFGLEAVWCEDIIASAVTDWEERAEVLLMNLAASAGRPDKETPLSDDTDYPLGHCEGPDEFRSVFRLLKSKNWVDDGIRCREDYSLSGCHLTFDGWRHAQELPEIRESRKLRREMVRLQKLRSSVLQRLLLSRNRGTPKLMQQDLRRDLGIESIDWGNILPLLENQQLVKLHGDFMWLTHSGALQLEAELCDRETALTSLTLTPADSPHPIRNITIMGDQYNTNQAMAVGPQAIAQAEIVTFNQAWNQAADRMPLPQLASDLSRLLPALKDAASAPEEYQALASVASAEAAAKEGDGPKTLENLKKAGGWALGIAEKIGVAIAAAALKEAIGVK